MEVMKKKNLPLPDVVADSPFSIPPTAWPSTATAST